MKKIAIVLAASALVSGCYQNPQSTLASGVKGSITASDQAAGQSISVAEINMPSNGWVVVHAVQDGQPVVTGSIGHVYVPAGPSSGVEVPLAAPLGAGEQVVAMLHLDTGAAKVFEFANGNRENLDPPVVVEGKPVTALIQLN